ncbi:MULTISPECIES: DegV family protein [Clostridium]|jgi:DegV family protein with EDD domain|uniref:DegV family protein n=1 Tax=Clostridium TaxID=1485 RepID=UPI0004B5D6C5|nr:MULTISPECIES: DegV family protein [Clostridium]MBX9185664.1 DegV family protein [Clostridium sp. K04]
MGIKIITDSACDLTRDYIKNNNIGLLSLILNLNGQAIKDDLGETLSYKDFYNKMREGATPTTSQINAHEFEEEFIKYIKNGDSIIYISLSSNLSGTFNSANIAKNNLMDEYPNANIYLVDSLSVSVGQGLLVAKACEMRDSGIGAEEIVNWLEENKRKVIHSILIDDLNHLKRGGRISGATAAIGGLLNIKPTLFLDDEGKLIQGEKIKGKKKALRFLVNEVREKAVDTENEILYICHGDCLEEAETLRDMILEEVKFKNVIINYVGNVVGAHAGPGVLAAVFLGSNR